MRLPSVIDQLRRKRLGRYEIDDPRTIAAEAPYTFFLPSSEELEAVSPGDLVKIIIRSIPASAKWDGERMWVIVKESDGDRLVGWLDNEPLDIPQLRAGDRIAFERHHIIDIMWGAERTAEPPQPEAKHSYWERCLVDNCVTEERIPVHFLYREEPETMREGETYPDSGWRIRGDYRGLTDEELSERKVMYVSLAVALNADDSWIHLIDAPIGSAFIRDWETGAFVPESQRE